MFGTSWVGTPRPADRAPCGSKSTASTLRPHSARLAPRLMVVVVLPTPPFWLHRAMMRAGPCPFSGFGSGKIRAHPAGRAEERRLETGKFCGQGVLLGSHLRQSFALGSPVSGVSILTGASCCAREARGTSRDIAENTCQRARGCAVVYMSRSVSAVTRV